MAFVVKYGRIGNWYTARAERQTYVPTRHRWEDRPDSFQQMKMSHHAHIRSVWNGLSFRPITAATKALLDM